MDINNLLNVLEKDEKIKEKQEILDIMNLLKDELNEIIDIYDKEAFKAVQDDYNGDKVNEIGKTARVIKNIINEINCLNVSKTEIINEEIIDFSSDLTNTIPKKIEIDGEIIKNEEETWKNALYLTLKYFIDKFPNRFNSYTMNVNNRKIENFKFTDKPTINNNIYIKEIKKYLIYDKTNIKIYFKDILDFFKYENKYCIYGEKKKKTTSYNILNDGLIIDSNLVEKEN